MDCGKRYDSCPTHGLIQAIWCYGFWFADEDLFSEEVVDEDNWGGLWLLYDTIWYYRYYTMQSARVPII